MKKTNVLPGDRLLIQPQLSKFPPFRATFHHMHRGGMLMVEPVKPAPTGANQQVVGCSWKSVIALRRIDQLNGMTDLRWAGEWRDEMASRPSPTTTFVSVAAVDSTVYQRDHLVLDVKHVESVQRKGFMACVRMAGGSAICANGYVKATWIEAYNEGVRTLGVKWKENALQEGERDAIQSGACTYGHRAPPGKTKHST